MRQTVLLHLTNEELILGEIDQLPNLADQFMIIHKPRQRDGTKLAHLQENVSIILVPWHQIAYVQLMPGSEIDEVIGFIRE
jgi:hypothetical protein